MEYYVLENKTTQFFSVARVSEQLGQQHEIWCVCDEEEKAIEISTALNLISKLTYKNCGCRDDGHDSCPVCQGWSQEELNRK